MYTRIVIIAVLLVAIGATLAIAAPKPKTVRDLMWVWAVTAIKDEGEKTAATWAQAGPIQKSKILGAPNVTMCGNGLPADRKEADALTKAVRKAPHLVWEVTADEVPEGQSGGFVYKQRMETIRYLADRYRNLEGILLDDMSTVGRSHGFKPEHIRGIRDLLPGKYERIKMWGVVYTMSLKDEGINDYIKECDVVNLWTWHGRDIPDMEKNVAHVEGLFPGKPIVLGLYMYNYGEGKRMSADLMKQQCETALKLALEKRIQGIVFLTINDDPDIVGWTADWITKVGSRKLP